MPTMKHQKRCNSVFLILAFGIFGLVSAAEVLWHTPDYFMSYIAPYEILDPVNEQGNSVRTCRAFLNVVSVDGDSRNPDPEYGETGDDLNDWRTLCELWNTSEEIDLLDRVFALRTHVRKEREWNRELSDTKARLRDEITESLKKEDLDTLTDIVTDLHANLDKIWDILEWTRDSSDILLNATTTNESQKAFKKFERSLKYYENRRYKNVSIASSKTRSCEARLANNSPTYEWNTKMVYELIDEVNEWADMCIRSSNDRRESDAVDFAFTVMNQLRKASFENDWWIILIEEVNKTTNISQIRNTVLGKLDDAKEISNRQLIYLASMRGYIDNLKEAKDPEQRLAAVVAIENAKREYENLDKRVYMIRPENKASGGPIRHRW